MKSSYSKGYLIALSGTVFWSFTGILISYLSRNYALPSLVLAFWRDLFVSISLAFVFLVVSRRRFRLDHGSWKFMLLYGFTLSVFNSFWTFSVEYNRAAVATVLAFSSPAFTAILSRLVFKEKFDRLKVLSILFSLLGIFLVSGAYDPSMWKLNPLGLIFGLLTGVAFAFYNLEGKVASDRKIESWTALLYSFAIATVFLLLYNFGVDKFAGRSPLSDLLWLGDSASGWGLLLLLAIAPTLGGYGLYTLSLRYLPPTVANLIATLEPPLTAILAFFLLGEQLTAVQWIGSLLVFAGVILLRSADRGE